MKDDPREARGVSGARCATVFDGLAARLDRLLRGEQTRAAQNERGLEMTSHAVDPSPRIRRAILSTAAVGYSSAGVRVPTALAIRKERPC